MTTIRMTKPKCNNPNALYYDYSTIDGTQAVVRIIESDRGLGKSYKMKRDKCLRRVFTPNKQVDNTMFIYVVEHKDTVTELCDNNGYAFANHIISAEDTPEWLRGYMLDLTYDNRGNILYGKTLKGRILYLSQFAKMKSTDFANNLVSLCFEELIPERVDIRHFGTATNKGTAYRIGSLIQSLSRRKNILIYGACNPIRPNDPIYSALKIADKPCGLHRIVESGHNIVAFHKVNEAVEYPKYVEVKESNPKYALEKLLGSAYVSAERDKQRVHKPLDALIQYYVYVQGLYIGMYKTTTGWWCNICKQPKQKDAELYRASLTDDSGYTYVKTLRYALHNAVAVGLSGDKFAQEIIYKYCSKNA